VTKTGKVKVRLWTLEDLPAIVECHKAVYSDLPLQSLYDERIYRMQFQNFPEGQYLAEIDGKVVGYATSLIILMSESGETYRYPELTGSGTFNTHDPAGDVLYGADIGVHPDYRGKGIAAKIYERRRRLLKRFNLKKMFAYGRIPGFKEYAGKMTAEQYVDRVVKGEIKDSALTAHLKAGYQVKKVVLDFVSDPTSLNYCTLLELDNPDFDAHKRRIAAAPQRRPVRKVRVCAAQYQMRRIKNWEEFQQNVEFFVDTADEYHCHFLVFPEYFTAQLISMFPPEYDFARAVRQLTSMTAQYIELLSRFAQQHQIYIIGGSHPIEREGKIYNVSHFFTPSGKVLTQDKLHITPTERKDWGVNPGIDVNVFETSFGRVAIQICYDVEFPEVSRLLSLAGVEILFVPFSTDEKKAYNRVRYCAQARAVENYIYVVIAGNVGNLPTIKNYLLNYGQAAVLTPSDFAFPVDGIAGQADPNTETVVVADLDLDSLAQQREFGSVRPFYDRRPDLYELISKTKINLIKAD
jgi:predicted amidohydrolase/GNAT superfamily N-acetyltransferase